MKMTFDQFICFAQTFQENNCFDFSKEAITETEPGVFSYNACFRDSSNFKSPVTLTYNLADGEIRWDVYEGWEEAYEELESLEDWLLSESDQSDEQVNADRDRVYRVLQTIQQSIQDAEEGKISFSQVFNRLDIRHCLPEYTVLPTTWHIDDLEVELGTLNLSPDELFDHLKAMSLEDAAIRAGWDCILYECQEIRSKHEEG